MSDSPLVSVVIPHYNDIHALETCLKLLARQTIEAASFEVIVADNNSSCGLDPVKAVAGEFATVVSEQIPGAGEARNAGIRAARGRYLAFTDSDCRPAPDWLERGLASLSRAQIVGGQVDVLVDNENDMTGAEAFEVVFAFNNKRYVEKQNYSVTANMFVSREVFDEVGEFRRHVSEDMEWGNRAAAKGFTLAYAPDVKVSHPARRSWADLRRKAERITREQYLLFKERPGGLLVWSLRTWLVLLSVPIHVRKIFTSERVRGSGRRLAAAAMLFRIRAWRFFAAYKIMLVDGAVVSAIQLSQPLSQDPIQVAIVGYRNATDIAQCLRALARSKERRFNISICENGGVEAYTDLIAALDGLMEFSEVMPAVSESTVSKARAGRLSGGAQVVRLYLAAANIGYAAGVNLCIRQLEKASWSALWVLNPDTEPDEAALSALVDYSQRGQYDIVGSRTVYKATGLVQAYGGRWRKFLARGHNIGMYSRSDRVPDVANVEHEMNYVLGSSMFVTKRFIEAAGLMDERYFLYCEEVDWCLRRPNVRLGYAHDSIVYHAGSSTIGSNRTARDRSGLSVYLAARNGLLLTRRFFPLRYPLVLMMTLLLTLRYLQQGALKNFYVSLLGWWSGLRGETGRPVIDLPP